MWLTCGGSSRSGIERELRHGRLGSAPIRRSLALPYGFRPKKEHLTYEKDTDPTGKFMLELLKVAGLKPEEGRAGRSPATG
jgi:hypothetical protein